MSALPVSSSWKHRNEVPFSSLPESAEQYLRWVRKQADQRPHVVSANVPTTQERRCSPTLPQQRRWSMIPTCPFSAPEKMPQRKWQQQFSARFAELRNSLARLAARKELPDALLESCCLPHANDAHGWQAILRDQVRYPLLSEIIWLDEVTTRSALEHAESVLASDQDLNEIMALWLYSLLLKLDKPLLPDMSSCLRTIYRILATIRALKEDATDSTIPLINLLLTIIHFGFGQYVEMDEESESELLAELGDTKVTADADTDHVQTEQA